MDNGTDGYPLGAPSSYGVTTVDQCLTHCGLSGYTYAGIEGATCYCSNVLDHTAATEAPGSCDTACDGDSTQACAGKKRRAFSPRVTERATLGHIIIYKVR